MAVVVKQLQGKAYYAKVFKAVPNYNKDGFEWAFDVTVDKKTKELLTSLGLESKIKNKGTEAGDFITFKRATVKRFGEKKGEENDPIRVLSSDGKTDWDKTKLIGNGSVINVKFTVNETIDPRTKKKGMRADPLAIQVWQHVAYENKQEFDSNPEVESDVEAEGSKDW